MLPSKFSGYALTKVGNFDSIKKITYDPKPFGDYDIDIQIEACGVCGSDCLTASAEWGEYKTPLVVGHEIVGKAINVGPKVQEVKVGDRVGVGAQVWACLQCDVCKEHHENYCPKQVDTYNAPYPDGYIAQGGYASHVRVHEHFVFQIPKSLATESAAPLMCAGITTFAPLSQNFKNKGQKVGIVGLGGLGHIAVMFAKKLGYEVHVFSRGTAKKEDAFKLGADYYHNSEDEDVGKNIQFTLDLIISTAKVSSIPLNKFLSTIKVFGKFISLGLPPDPFTLTAFDLNPNAVSFSSSHLGNRKELKSMLQFAAEHNISPWIEKLAINEEAVEVGLKKTNSNGARYRVVLTDFSKQFN